MSNPTADYGMGNEMRELEQLEQRQRELQQQIRQKKHELRFETLIEDVYYEHIRGRHATVRPAELGNLSHKKKHAYVETLTGLDTKSKYKVKGKIGWNGGPLFNVTTPRKSLPGNKKLRSFLDDVVIHTYHTWHVLGNTFTVEWGNGPAHFYLIWPKGDGSRYDIFDLKKVPGDKIREKARFLEHLSTFAYGKLEAAYKTKSDLAVFRFHLKKD